MPLPPATGVGFKPEHFEAIRTTAPALGFFEVHAENYRGASGLSHAQLSQSRADYALLLHGVGLSIGGADELSTEHLARLKAFATVTSPTDFRSIWSGPAMAAIT